MTAAEEQLVAELAEALPFDVMQTFHGPIETPNRSEREHAARELLPVVLADRRRAVAEALREAADSIPCFCEHAADYGVSCPRHGTAYEHVTARADAVEGGGR